MLYIVEVRRIGGDLIAAMTEMRTWLDHQHIEPDAFRHSSGGAGITFRVDFKAETAAAAFARAFDGRIVGLQPSHAGEHALWPSGLAAGADAAERRAPRAAANEPRVTADAE